MLKKRPVLGLALGGGSAKGLAHIGVIKVLVEEGINIDMISGTSIGAIVGGIYALNPDVEYLIKRARELVFSEAFTNLKLDKFTKNEGGWFGRIKSRFKDGITLAESLMKESIIKKELTEKVFKEIFGDYDIRDTKIPFSCVALDLITGDDVIFFKGPLWKTAMASAAIPGVFPPVNYENYMLVDGGVTANVPIEAVKKMGSNKVIGVIVGGKLKELNPPKTALEVILRADEIAKFKLFRTTLKEANLIIDIDLKDFHWTDFSRIDELIKKGEEAAREATGRIKELTKPKGFLERIFRRNQ